MHHPGTIHALARFAPLLWYGALTLGALLGGLTGAAIALRHTQEPSC